MKYILEKPDLSSISQKRKEFIHENIIDIFFENKLYKFSGKKYLYWDKIKFQEIPDVLESHEELWYVIKNMRNFWMPTIIKDELWKMFTLWKPDYIEELLHTLDLKLGWSFLNIELSDSERRVFLQNGIAEEAISSSQIEWALTSSKVAKEMIAKWRKPNTKDEKMIINNYQAMQFVKDEMKDTQLDLPWLIELQAILTKWTLDESDQVGRLRNDADEIVVQNSSGTKILHEPMLENKMKKELKELIRFANDEDKLWFIHPFVKAVMLHFWIGYLHPFCDGNGRTARAIFYWYLIKKWYWGFSFIPVSKAINNSRKQYWNAYLYTEQDNNDMTYFLVYIANKVIQSMDEFHEYVRIKIEKQKNVNRELAHLWLNDRQKKLIAYFLERPKSYTNITIHKNYNSIANDTAKRDLKDLENKWFLTIQKQWTYVNYFPVEDLTERTK